MNKLVGLILLAVGSALVFWGYSAAGSVGSKLNQVLMGSPSDKAMALYIGGGISAALGLFQIARK